MKRVNFLPKRALILAAKIVVESRGKEWSDLMTDQEMWDEIDIDTETAIEIGRKIKRRSLESRKDSPEKQKELDAIDSSRTQIFHDFWIKIKDRSNEIHCTDKSFRQWKRYIREPNFDPGISTEIAKSKIDILPKNEISNSQVGEHYRVYFISRFFTIPFSKRIIELRKIKEFQLFYIHNDILIKKFRWADCGIFLFSDHYDMIMNRMYKKSMFSWHYSENRLPHIDRQDVLASRETAFRYLAFTDREDV